MTKLVAIQAFCVGLVAGFVLMAILATPARADECVKPEAWLSNIAAVAAQHQLTPHVIAQKDGDEAKRLVAAMNAAPPPTSIPGDQFIVVGLADANGQPVPFALVGFFLDGCMTKLLKAGPNDVPHLLNGDWPKAPEA